MHNRNAYVYFFLTNQRLSIRMRAFLMLTHSYIRIQLDSKRLRVVRGFIAKELVNFGVVCLFDCSFRLLVCTTYKSVVVQ